VQVCPSAARWTTFLPWPSPSERISSGCGPSMCTAATCHGVLLRCLPRQLSRTHRDSTTAFVGAWSADLGQEHVRFLAVCPALAVSSVVVDCSSFRLRLTRDRGCSRRSRRSRSQTGGHAGTAGRRCGRNGAPAKEHTIPPFEAEPPHLWPGVFPRSARPRASTPIVRGVAAVAGRRQRPGRSQESMRRRRTDVPQMPTSIRWSLAFR
jgi:hypothetical protein